MDARIIYRNSYVYTFSSIMQMRIVTCDVRCDIILATPFSLSLSLISYAGDFGECIVSFLETHQIHDANGFQFLFREFSWITFFDRKHFNRNQNMHRRLENPAQNEYCKYCVFTFYRRPFHWMNPKAAACIACAYSAFAYCSESIARCWLRVYVCICARFTYYMHLHKNQDVESRNIQCIFVERWRRRRRPRCMCV